DLSLDRFQSTDALIIAVRDKKVPSTVKGRGVRILGKTCYEGRPPIAAKAGASGPCDRRDNPVLHFTDATIKLEYEKVSEGIKCRTRGKSNSRLGGRPPISEGATWVRKRKLATGKTCARNRTDDSCLAIDPANGMVVNIGDIKA